MNRARRAYIAQDDALGLAFRLHSTKPPTNRTQLQNSQSIQNADRHLNVHSGVPVTDRPESRIIESGPRLKSLG